MGKQGRPRLSVEVVGWFKQLPLRLGWAITVHKSQGSEYEYVILYIPEDKAFNSFLNINLLYTAITRTKRCIWVISSKETLSKTGMTETASRYDGLATSLQNMRNDEAEKSLSHLIIKPEFTTGSHLSTAVTVVPDSYESFEDIEALYSY
jgi:exodeoxyribonuclease V alpha subunit